MKQWGDETPSVTVRCMSSSRLQSIDPVELKFALCPHCHEPIALLSAELAAREAAEEASAHVAPRENPKVGVVYYMRFGDRIKIGFTEDLRARAKQIPNDEVVAAEPGTMSLERQRHLAFESDRVEGQREWFDLTPRLAFHMANVRDKHGAPFRVGRTLGLAA
ncbi:GIY-YIG nuclease family protein [Leucobacter sp. USCH14]|uniref:GIY-YIG nuclease family protein n=1 Tax=Leucobacter sp. USCH14 TaxID=3024838 RepID=UPI0030ABE2EA